MAKVESWFWGWQERFVERFPRGDWPPVENEYWAELLKLFVRKGVTEEVAFEAISLLFESPPEFVNKFPEAILARVREVWKSSEGPSAAHALDDRDTAARLSAHCPECTGQGITHREHPDPPDPERPFPISLYCTCPLGRFIEKAHRTKAPDLRRRFLDLADHPALWREGPAEHDAAAEAHWASLPEPDREEARALVIRRFPWARSRPNWLEGLAKGWAYDPTLVASEPPPRAPSEPRAKTGPRKIFQ